jgi:uncharacterized protein YyaL (SSP411 family)
MANRLEGERSPYLRAHADQPVDWYPWGPEAFERARREDRPVLLSIGYSSCHWCHVMARESFQDPGVAGFLNDNFVCVKVDREERPDIDQIYQLAYQMLARRGGGWPLTMLLTADQVPFFGATYLPRIGQHGITGLVDVMERVLVAWRERRADIEAQNPVVLDAMRRTDRVAESAGAGQAGGLPDAGLIDMAVFSLGERADREHGGFGKPPKFPHPMSLELCLRQFARSGDPDALRIALGTLEGMARGGLFDHLGGGFFRYSTDETWTIPHFEKMLSDNALLVPLYAAGWQITGDPLYRTVVERTVDWMLREMRLPGGGLATSLDADQQDEEGRFYLWQAEEALALIEPADRALVAAHFGLDQAANYVETDYQAWHLCERASAQTLAEREGLALEAVQARLDAARTRLVRARAERSAPARDDKLLTGWNALAVRALARAARAFCRDDWAAEAKALFAYLSGPMMPEGRLHALGGSDGVRLPAWLDDHACLLEAAIEVLQLGVEPAVLAAAETLADQLLAHFADPQAGGFFFAGDAHETLLCRTRRGFDEATPSGNAVAARALARLALFSGDDRWQQAARGTLAAFGPAIGEQPSAFGSMLEALLEQHEPPTLVVLRGSAQAMVSWQAALARRYRPGMIVLPVDVEVPPAALPPSLAHPVPDAGVQAHVCRDGTCLAPVDTLEAVLALLGAAPASPLAAGIFSGTA